MANKPSKNCEQIDTEYDRAKVPPYNGNDPPPAPGSLKAPLFPPLLNEVQNNGTQGVRARYGADISIVRYPGRPVISVPDFLRLEDRAIVDFLTKLHCTWNLEKKGKFQWRKFKNSVEMAPRHCRFLFLVVVERFLTGEFRGKFPGTKLGI